MFLDRADRNPEFGRDRPVGPAIDDQAQDLGLACREMRGEAAAMRCREAHRTLSEGDRPGKCPRGFEHEAIRPAFAVDHRGDVDMGEQGHASLIGIMHPGCKKIEPAPGAPVMTGVAEIHEPRAPCQQRFEIKAKWVFPSQRQPADGQVVRAKTHVGHAHAVLRTEAAPVAVDCNYRSVISQNGAIGGEGFD